MEAIKKRLQKIMSATGREPSYVRKKKNEAGARPPCHAPLAAFWRARRSLMLTMNQLGLTPAVIRPL